MDGVRPERIEKTPLVSGVFFTTGAGDRNRTDDLRITNALLYQLSYTGNGVNYKRLSGVGQIR